MSAWLPTAPCTPQLCAPRPDGLRRGPFAASARLLAGVGAVVLGILLVPVVALFAAGLRDRLTRGWTRTVIRLFGLRIRVDGPELSAGAPGGVLVVANHISWLDIPLIATLYPGRVLAKSDIRRWPVLGAVAELGGTLFVERDRLRALPGTVRDIRDALRAGSRVIVFPEGSTWCGRDQGRFTNAVFQAALDAGADVRPVRIGYRPLGPAAFVGDDPLAVSLWRIAVAGGLTAEIEVLPLIPAGSHPDRRSLARAAQGAVAGADVTRTASDHAAAVRTVNAPPPVGRTVTVRTVNAPPPVGRTVTVRTAVVHAAAVQTAALQTAAVQTATDQTAAVQTAVASDSAKRPASSVHQCANSIPAPASSERTVS